MSNTVLDVVKWVPTAWAKVKEWSTYAWSLKELYPFPAGIVAGFVAATLLRVIF